MTENELRELFREMRDEPVPADSQARVRLAVAERAQNWRERLRRHWRVATAILSPALVALLALLVHESGRVRVTVQPVAIWKAPVPVEVPPPAAPAPQVAQVSRRPARSAHRTPAVARNSDSNEPATVIRIETPDPDVVILLVGG